MKLVAITTLPPSNLPLSSFGLQAIKRFLELSNLETLIILADKHIDNQTSIEDSRVLIDRCWKFGEFFTSLRLLRRVHSYSPDVIWINLQYTTFGVSPLSAFFGLLLPLLIRATGIPTVITLHNLLAVIDLAKMNLEPPILIRLLLPAIDKVVMWSILSANRIFVLEPSYFNYLAATFPKKSISYVEQDLYEIPKFEPIPECSLTVVTMGYFGTYKRLEPLIAVLQEVRRSVPSAKLQVIGLSHTHTPTYLEDLRNTKPWCDLLENIEFLGYVADDNIHNVLWNCRILVVTNTTSTGSSAVLRYAARHGRGLVVPDIKDYRELPSIGWGVVTYKAGDVMSLQSVLECLLSDLALCRTLGEKSYQKIQQYTDTFTKGHIDAFKMLVAERR